MANTLSKTMRGNNAIIEVGMWLDGGTNDITGTWHVYWHWTLYCIYIYILTANEGEKCYIIIIVNL